MRLDEIAPEGQVKIVPFEDRALTPEPPPPGWDQRVRKKKRRHDRPASAEGVTDA